MNALALLVGMTLVTFGVRWGSLALAGARPLPGWLRAALRYVPLAVLAAIVAPELVLHPQTGTLYISAANSALMAGGVGWLVAWRTRNLLLTICVGMMLYAAHRALLL